jgi:AraC-like DNA-binding protein
MIMRAQAWSATRRSWLKILMPGRVNSQNGWRDAKAREEAGTMSWNGEVFFGSSWAAFRGQASSNSFHAHAAIQLTISDIGPVRVWQRDQSAVTSAGVCVAPSVVHRLEANGKVTLIFIEPQSAIAQDLLRGQAKSAVFALSPSILEAVDIRGPLASCLSRLSFSSTRADSLDVRLATALQFLEADRSPNAIANAAKSVNLSDSRLRVLARKQLGTQLSTWLMWRKLERAGKELEAGATLAQAAHAGGFADQAHFTRTTRKLFGITPKTLSNLIF